MSEYTQRLIGGVLGFALAVVWIVAGLGSATICLLAASVGFGLAVARQRIQWRRVVGGILSTRTKLEASAAARAQRVRASQRPRHAPKPARRREVHRPRTPLAADPGSYGW